VAKVWAGSFSVPAHIPQSSNLVGGAYNYVFTPSIIRPLHAPVTAWTNFPSVQIFTDFK